MKQIKLVIWDLDETFWKGTLSEGPVIPVPEHQRVVHELTCRGIVNSIASKNTFADAKACLEQQGVWDCFVFPKIAWQPKGPLLASIIEDMQLRPENVLFIDDNHLNREEARHYSPGLQTAGPEIIGGLLELEACRGKDDSALSRLKQYRLLEQKARDRQEAAGGNEAFLRSCNIRVRVCRDCTPEKERLLELINRTNQLNYTKHRLTAGELEKLLMDPSVETAYVQVTDTYGDYGICGFYALAGGVLAHFLFSCRILNMGVEHWLYHRLGCPGIDITGEVATPLAGSTPPDWISEGSPAAAADGHQGVQHKQQSVHIIIKGGCDLLQTQAYLMRGGIFAAEVDYVSDAGYRINNSHTEIVKRCTQSSLKNYGAIIDKLYFLDRSAFRTDFFSSNYHVCIYSVLDDYTRGLYRYRTSDFIIPFGDYTLDLTDQATWEYHSRRSGKHRLSPDFMEWFKNSFSFVGPIDPSSFKQNIAWLCSNIPRDRLLIILNGSEIPFGKGAQQQRWERHRALNRALEETVDGMPHAAICDVRKFVQSPADHVHNIRHYTRQVYFHIAGEINAIIEERCHVSRSFWEKQKHFLKYMLKVRENAPRKAAGKKMHALL